MVRIFIVFIFGLLYFKTAVAQKDTAVYYLKSSGALVATKDAADFYIVVRPPGANEDKRFFMVDGYYLDNKKLFTAMSFTSTLPLKLQGLYSTFSENGNIISTKYYDHGTQTGDYILYYPDGHFYCKKSYVTGLDDTTAQLLFEDCNDQTGKVLAKNGNGVWVNYDDKFRMITETGRIKDGLQDSIWTYYSATNGRDTEMYKNGKIVAMPGGRIFSQVESVPEFPGGLEAFGQFLAKNVRYPDEARRKGIQGKVFISFVVEKDGTLTNFRVARGIGGGCDEEALKVIKASPKWKPGVQNHHAVRVAYSVPINFTLNDF